MQAVFDAAPAAEALVYQSGPLVLDRDPLRTKLSSLEANTLPLNVLVVRGKTKAGKSYGRHLFERVARSRGAKIAYLWSGNAASLEAAVAELYLALEVDEVPDLGEVDTTGIASYQPVLRDLHRAAVRTDRTLWVTVDDLGNGPDDAPLIDRAVRDFCDQFALNLLNPAFAARFRLMLIHYPEGPVPTRWPSELWGGGRREGRGHRGLARAGAPRRVGGRARGGSCTTASSPWPAAEIIAAGEADPGPDGPYRLERLHAAMTDALQGLEQGEVITSPNPQVFDAVAFAAGLSRATRGVMRLQSRESHTAGFASATCWLITADLGDRTGVRRRDRRVRRARMPDRRHRAGSEARVPLWCGRRGSKLPRCSASSAAPTAPRRSRCRRARARLATTCSSCTMPVLARSRC